MKAGSASVRFRLGLILACTVCSVSAWASVDSVAILPAKPTAADDIAARVDGGLPDSCWSYTGNEVRISGAQIEIEVRAERSGDLCMPVIQPYSFVATIGRLAAGTYQLTILDPQEKKSIDFTVEASREFVPGDANNDGSLNIADAVFILSFLFARGPEPACELSANVNGDADINIADAIFLLSHLFAHGPPAASGDCRLSVDCIDRAWEVFCVGHWSCACGACRSTCDTDGCGDGFCNRSGGETPESCPGDCDPSCKPECRFIGTKSEGWYDSCTGKRYSYANCAGCEAACRNCGSRSEGWYDSCGGELITWADCDCP